MLVADFNGIFCKRGSGTIVMELDPGVCFQETVLIRDQNSHAGIPIGCVNS